MGKKRKKSKTIQWNMSQSAVALSLFSLRMNLNLSIFMVSCSDGQFKTRVPFWVFAGIFKMIRFSNINDILCSQYIFSNFYPFQMRIIQKHYLFWLFFISLKLFELKIQMEIEILQNSLYIFIFSLRHFIGHTWENIFCSWMILYAARSFSFSILVHSNRKFPQYFSCWWTKCFSFSFNK